MKSRRDVLIVMNFDYPLIYIKEGKQKIICFLVGSPKTWNVTTQSLIYELVSMFVNAIRIFSRELVYKQITDSI